MLDVEVPVAVIVALGHVSLIDAISCACGRSPLSCDRTGAQDGALLRHGGVGDLEGERARVEAADDDRCNGDIFVLVIWNMLCRSYLLDSALNQSLSRPLYFSNSDGSMETFSGHMCV